MAGEVYVPKRLEERGVRIAVPIEDPDVWQRRVENDPGLPASYGELRDLVERHFSKKGQVASPADAVPAAGEQPLTDLTCGESLYARIYGGLANPGLAAAERDSIEAVLAEATPTDWNVRDDFPHFILRWTETDPDPANNLDAAHAPALIAEAGALLEQAWNRFNMAFGIAPFAPPATGKIQVDFQDLPDDLEGQAEPPKGPIVFDAQRWQASQALRAPLAAHELFHKLQYAFDFRVTWAQTASDVEWFSEGTARWAEVFVHQRLTAVKWLMDWLAKPNRDFFGAGSFTLPFWIFLNVRRHPNGLVDLLTSCQAQKDAVRGLEQVVSNVAGDLSELFALFAAEVKVGDWRRLSSGQTLYPQILGPDGLPHEPTVGTTSVSLGAGQSFESPAPIKLGELASCYHAFAFAPEADGQPLRLEVLSAETLTHQVIFLRAGLKVGASSTVSGNFVHAQAIQLAAADTLLLVTSTRGVPAQVEVSAQVS
jgi:hypothetical protein